MRLELAFGQWGDFNMTFEFNPFKDGITQGLLTMFMRCREEARNHINGLEQIRTSGALQFGSMTHEVLELIYSHFNFPPTESTIVSTIDDVRTKFLKEEGGRLSGEGMANLEQNIAMMEAVLPLYFQHYKGDFKKDYWVELEKVFRVPSPVKGIDLIGRIDGAFRPRPEELWLFESKTKGRIEEDNLSDTLTFDFQNNVYQYALKHKYQQRPKGVLYNIIRRPGNKLGKDEQLSKFSSRIRDAVVKDPSYYFIRFEVAVPQTELNRFEVELKKIIEEFVLWWRGELATYRNTSACMQRYGACRFLPKCANGEVGLYRQRENMFPELVESK